jgi:hypothetical protein
VVFNDGSHVQFMFFYLVLRLRKDVTLNLYKNSIKVVYFSRKTVAVGIPCGVPVYFSVFSGRKPAQ